MTEILPHIPKPQPENREAPLIPQRMPDSGRAHATLELCALAGFTPQAVARIVAQDVEGDIGAALVVFAGNDVDDGSVQVAGRGPDGWVDAATGDGPGSLWIADDEADLEDSGFLVASGQADQGGLVTVQCGDQTRRVAASEEGYWLALFRGVAALAGAQILASGSETQGRG